MMKLLCFSISLVILIGYITPAFSEDAPRMTKEELRTLLGNPDLMIIDVRYGSSWTGSDSKIKGAVREDPEDLKSWVDKYPKDKTIVLY